MSTPSDYSTVAAAIRFLNHHRHRQPALAQVAAAVGLSPFHFQRVFKRWAGVSPKRFLQYLTFQDASARLRASEPLLEAAFSAGLSGPGRLHDLFINTVSATPGEFKRGGQGLEILHGVQKTPFGQALLGATPRGLCHLSFLEDGDPRGLGALEVLQAEWPRAQLRKDEARTRELAETIFREAAAQPDTLTLHLRGTNFQIRVWEALLRVPSGAVTTYGRLARALGKPGAARAVGSAVGKNRIAWLIPCHRVIREEGILGGYRWDPVRKEAMLVWEGLQTVLAQDW